MSKSFVTLTAAIAALSLALLTLDNARAGSATSAPSKYQQVYHHQAQHHVPTYASDFAITEFSSSSAKSSTSKK
jgi:hypothetical protein